LVGGLIGEWVGWWVVEWVGRWVVEWVGGIDDIWTMLLGS